MGYGIVHDVILLNIASVIIYIMVIGLLITTQNNIFENASIDPEGKSIDPDIELTTSFRIISIVSMIAIPFTFIRPSLQKYIEMREKEYTYKMRILELLEHMLIETISFIEHRQSKDINEFRNSFYYYTRQVEERNSDWAISRKKRKDVSDINLNFQNLFNIIYSKSNTHHNDYEKDIIPIKKFINSDDFKKGKDLKGKQSDVKCKIDKLEKFLKT